MADISVPAFCPRCNIVVPSNVTLGGECRDIRFEGWGVKCRQCGENASVIDGTYNFVGEVLELFPPGSSMPIDLTKFVEILKKAQHTRPSAAGIAAEVRKEAPSLAPFVAKYLPKDSAALAAWIAVILSMIGLLYKAPGPTTTIYQTINIQAPTAHVAAPADKSRNKPCPCGSGKEFKTCCGAAH